MNTAVSWPCSSSGCTWPVSLIVTLSALAITNSRNICAGVGEPIQTEPVSGSGSSGVLIDTVPTFDASGQLLAANCASVQPLQAVGDRRR